VAGFAMTGFTAGGFSTSRGVIEECIGIQGAVESLGD
jgi:hypothetical protein